MFAPKQHFLSRFEVAPAMSIMRRTVLLSFGVTFGVVMVLIAIIYPSQKHLQQVNINNHGMDIATSVADITESALILEDYTSAIEHCLKLLNKSPSVLYIKIIKKDGFVLAHDAEGWRQETLDAESIAKISTISSGRFKRNLGRSKQLYEYSHAFEFLTVDWGWIQVGLSTEDYQHNLHQIARNMGMAALLCLGFALIASYFFARRMVRPLSSLLEATQKIADGDLSIRAEVKSGDEIELLAQSFNQMTSSLEHTQHDLTHARDHAENALKAKSEFLANMSHEVRTPMNGVIGMLDLLTRTELSSAQQKYVNTIEKSAEGLLTVINDILDFSRIEAGKLKLESIQFNLRREVNLVCSLLAPRAEAKGLDLKIDLVAGVPRYVFGDPTRLRQILINLMGNAVKFTDHGHVAVRVALLQSMGDTVDIEFTVTDTGVGIAPNRLETIFDSFTQADGSTTRQYGGSGLGLTISRHIVDLMGGTIEVTSDPGQGSVFRFSVRLDRRGLEHERNPNLLPGQISILLADVHDQRRHRLKGAIERWGADCRLVTASCEMLNLLQKNEQCESCSAIVMPQCCGDFSADRFAQAMNTNRALPRIPLFVIDAKTNGSAPTNQHFTGLLPEHFTADDLIDLFEENLIIDAQRCFKMPDARIDLPEKSMASHPAGKTLKMLVVEDNEVNRELVIEILSLRGIEADEASDGCQAVAKANQTEYDMILMDCQMPHMDGYTATGKIREQQTHHTPIIALTAHALEGEREKCLAAGMDDYLPNHCAWINF